MTQLASFLLILVPLVIIHEFGHFIMAKLGGIHVTRFAFGFGKKLFGFTYRGTEYRWNLIPLGGYVDFMGELVYTNKIPDSVNHFYNRPKWIRFLVLLMGPLFNLLLALGIFWAWYGIRPYHQPVYHGEPFTVGFVGSESPESVAGLEAGDRVISIDGREITDVRQLYDYIAFNPGKEVSLEILRRETTVNLVFTVPVHPVQGHGTFNFAPYQRTMVGRVIADMPAAAAGMKPHDIITAINDVAVPDLENNRHLSDLVQEFAPNGTMIFTILRDDRELDLNVQAVMREDRWLVGIQHSGEFREVDLSWKQSLVQGWKDCVQYSTLIYEGVRKLIIGELPIKTLSGPVDVSRVAKESLEQGLGNFFWLMALISLNLGLLNLLPIPVLDGGEILVLLVEWVTRKDFSLDTKMKIKMVGFVFIIALMGAVIISDIIKAVQLSGM